MRQIKLYVRLPAYEAVASDPVVSMNTCVHERSDVSSSGCVRGRVKSSCVFGWLRTSEHILQLQSHERADVPVQAVSIATGLRAS
jgi:hypothetical protein